MHQKIRGTSGNQNIQLVVETSTHMKQRRADFNSQRMTFVRGANGNIKGFASLSLNNPFVARYTPDGNLLLASVGGFVYNILRTNDNKKMRRSHIFGVLEGDTDVASRSNLFPLIDDNELTTWAASQVATVNSDLLFADDVAELGIKLWCLGARNDLIVAQMGNTPSTRSEIAESLKEIDSLLILLEKDPNDDFQFSGWRFFNGIPKKLYKYNFIYIGHTGVSHDFIYSSEVESIDENKEIYSLKVTIEVLENRSVGVFFLISLIREVWGQSFEMGIERAVLFRPETLSFARPQPVFRFSRKRG